MPVFTGKTGKLNGDLNRFLSQNTSLNHTLTLTLSHFVPLRGRGRNRHWQKHPEFLLAYWKTRYPSTHYSNTPLL
jgi:hypothetical protein